MSDIRLKRAYDPAANNDGARVLVDGMWPRGVKKEDAAIDHWLKKLAPSSGLRKWFGHDPDKWPEFKQAYKRELGSGEQKERLDQLRALYDAGRVTLVFAARDRKHNNAVVLKAVLQQGDWHRARAGKIM